MDIKVTGSSFCPFQRIPVLEHQIGEQKKAIDQEQLKRIELENENQSLREQLNYDKQVSGPPLIPL